MKHGQDGEAATLLDVRHTISSWKCKILLGREHFDIARRSASFEMNAMVYEQKKREYEHPTSLPLDHFVFVLPLLPAGMAWTRLTATFLRRLFILQVSLSLGSDLLCLENGICITLPFSVIRPPMPLRSSFSSRSFSTSRFLSHHLLTAAIFSCDSPVGPHDSMAFASLASTFFRIIQ